MLLDYDEMLWDIRSLSVLHKDIELVQNRHTGRLMIRRISPEDTYPLMKALCGIRHNNLMAVYDTRLQDGLCISLCEYINGAAPEERHYDRAEAVNIMCQICDGLTALHGAGIVHRDIKPENIMTDSTGNIKIIDYSISRLTDPSKRRDTELLGTAGYASPEQFGFSQTTARADIYSCGVLLNYLLTGGKLPGEEEYNGALTPIIRKCTEIDERNRFSSAEELKRALVRGRVSAKRRPRALPGFRGKGLLPKIVTSVFIAAWLFMLLVYINGFPMLLKTPPDNIVRQIVLCIDIMLLWTALPYILFGDVFRISERISPHDAEKGRYIERAAAISGIVLGFALIFAVLFIQNGSYI